MYKNMDVTADVIVCMVKFKIIVNILDRTGELLETTLYHTFLL